MKDHRQLGQEMDLFSFHEEAPGSVLWHPHGLTLFKTLQEYIRSLLIGYQEISTPILTKGTLFKKSGHLTHYKNNMFKVVIEKAIYYLKPMNCPASSLLYKSKTRSYKDLPLRLSDFGTLHRNELSGVLGGLFRLRQFTQDDAHLYVREDQIIEEVANILGLMQKIYKNFGFILSFHLATKPDDAMGTDKQWDETEGYLHRALASQSINYATKEGEGAFYGPKIDIHIEDSLKRDWQLATIQLDFQTPAKMNLEYIDSDGSKKRPIIIHRALLGSVERFIGILLEHYQGNLPTQFAPVQAIFIPVSGKHANYTKLRMKLVSEYRVEIDSSNNSVGKRVTLAKGRYIPNIFVVGDKEETEKWVPIII